MGRSAKFAKKVKKTSSSSQANSKLVATPAPTDQKKKVGLKSKAYKRKPGQEGNVLGDADYITLLMGGRRKAQEEAARLPQDPDP